MGGDGLKVDQRLSLNPAPFSSSKRAVSGARPSHNGKRRMPVIAGSVCTHLLPWGCHTIMELVLAALPVETTGALLRTGAMAEIAAILFVRAVMPELAPHYGLLFFFPVTPRWTCTRGFARVESWKQLWAKT